MGLLRRTLETRDSITYYPFVKDWLGRITGPGAPVTPTSAMGLAAVRACIRICAQGVANLPLHTYHRLPGGGAEPAPDFYLYSLLHDAPNPEMNAMNFIETLQAHVSGWGNGYAEIVRDIGQRPVELWPLRPDRMYVFRERDGRLVYRYTRVNGTRVDMEPDQVFHVPGLGFDGVTGRSVLADNHAVELSLAMEKFGTSFFRNNARPGTVMSHPKNMTMGAIERLQLQMQELKGSDNAGKTVVLEEGMSIDEIGVPPEQAQYLEGRRFQLGEVARDFGIPPHKIGDVERSTSWGTGIEEQNQQWLDGALGADLRRWEQTINRVLITKPYRATHYVEFKRDALLRADTLKRYQAHHLALIDGWKNDDEIRALEGMNPKPDGMGKTFYKAVNVVPQDQLGTEQTDAFRALLTPPFKDYSIDDLAPIATNGNGHHAPEVPVG
jgi:HK97 family phage portal protein